MQLFFKVFYQTVWKICAELLFNHVNVVPSMKRMHAHCVYSFFWNNIIPNKLK